MGSLNNQFPSFPLRRVEKRKNGMSIQEAIRSGKPFRRRGWPDDAVFVVYVEHDIVLTLEKDFSTSVELDVQDILADDWYLREDVTMPTSKYSSFWEVR
jgi:hypothetical protein